MLVPEQQAVGHIATHAWLPACPLVLTVLAQYVISSARAMRKDVQHLRHHMYDFKKA